MFCQKLRTVQCRKVRTQQIKKNSETLLQGKHWVNFEEYQMT